MFILNKFGSFVKIYLLAYAEYPYLPEAPQISIQEAWNTNNNIQVGTYKLDVDAHSNARNDTSDIVMR